MNSFITYRNLSDTIGIKVERITFCSRSNEPVNKYMVTECRRINNNYAEIATANSCKLMDNLKDVNAYEVELRTKYGLDEHGNRI